MSTCEFPNCSVTFSEFVAGPRIGSGSQGHVHEVYDQNGSRFCLKKLVSSPAAFAAESLAYMKKVSSPFVVPIYHAFKTEDFDNLIMELCEGASLQQFIQDNSLSPEDVWLVITQLVHALHHLHSAGIVHRDIKPSNVLLLSKERPLRVKVCDFGACRDLDGPTIKTSYGTERFMAPEMFSVRFHGSPVDIWALGVLIYFLVEKNYPFTTLPQLFTEEAPVSNSEFGELISSLLQKDPSKRPTAFHLLEHPKIVEYSQYLDLKPKTCEEVEREYHEIKQVQNKLKENVFLFEEVPKINREPDWEKLGEVTELDLSDNSELTSVDGIQLFTGLSSLYLSYSKVSNVTPLYNLSNLTELYLDVTEVDDISPLSLLTNLTDLDLNNTKVSDISVLCNLISLTYLDLSATMVSNVSSLSNLLSLNYLDLSSTRVSDISTLSNLLSLTYLDLSSTCVSDVSSLSILTNLTKLYLKSTNVSDVGYLSDCSNLTTLDLSFTSICNVSFVSNLANLTVLYLNSTSIRDISPLSYITNLTYLDLSGTNISNVSSLSHLIKLNELYLSSTIVSDISPLSNLTGLSILDLNDTKVIDVSPLNGLTNLTTLYLNSNVSNVDCLSHLSELHIN
ncbi:hypothetical protein RCL1_007840 [Eukaryota sp. TZLM3-RCL]